MGMHQPDILVAMLLLIIAAPAKESGEVVELLLADMELFAPVCRAILLDSGTSGGGHGTSLDPADLRRLKCPLPWYLAGGLGPHNLETMKTTGAAGFDLNSGVESAPGIKDHEKIRRAFTILRGKP